MASQVAYSRKNYELKVQAFNELRDGATALAGARRRARKITTWDPSTRKGVGQVMEKQHHLGRDIGGLANYFANKCSSALDIISADSFTIHYQIYGDIERRAAYGENTVSVFVSVVWELCPVDVRLYADVLDPVLAREKLVGASREGIPDFDQIAKCTSWDKNAVRALPDADRNMFKVLISDVKVGQSKLTRLVKGFLMLLEAIEREHVDVTLDIQHSLLYTPVDIIRTFQAGDRAYVWNSAPTSEAHSAVLWRMCGAYPPPELAGSHVTVPADAPLTYMVSQGAIAGNGRVVRLTPGLIYASLTTYAMDVSCTQYLQQALIIACSLQENRYFSNVRLPAVSSKFDLMVPAFVVTGTKLDKPVLSREMAISVGRVHQMLLFAGVKDVLTAAELSTAAGFDPVQSMRSFLGSQTTLLRHMGGSISAINIVEASMKMRVHELLRAADFSDILNLSVLEGAWLCQEATSTVELGILNAITDGQADLSGAITPLDLLCRELDLAAVRTIALTYQQARSMSDGYVSHRPIMSAKTGRGGGVIGQLFWYRNAITSLVVACGKQ